MIQIEKEINELTKQELYSKIRYNNRCLRKIAKGIAPEIDLDDYSGYFYYYDRNRAMLKEIHGRGKVGYTQLEKKIHEGTHGIAFKAQKKLESLLGY